MSFLTLSLPKEAATICGFFETADSGIDLDSINDGRDAERVHHVQSKRRRQWLGKSSPLP
jgi:hypothetical protein